jgi:hypothetical protein
VSYDMIQRLMTDTNFRSRVQSCMLEQAQTYATDSDPATAWMANEQLKGNNQSTQAMVNLIASFPGLVDQAVATSANKVEFLDQTCITDAEVLGQVQTGWKYIAALFYVPPPTPPSLT